MMIRLTPKVAAGFATVLMAIATPAIAQDMPGGMGGGDMGGEEGMGGGGMHGGGRGGHGSSEGEDSPRGPRAPKAISRARFDQIVTGMFHAADTNRDGVVTIDELHAIVGSRRAVIIKNRFATVDTDRNGMISMAEFTAWQDRMGSVANSDAAATGDNGAPIFDGIMPDLGHDRALAGLIEPLTGTVIASANTNFDAGVSLAELLAYEGKFFEAADTDHDGYLWPQDLRARGQDGGGRMHRPGGAMGTPPQG